MILKPKLPYCGLTVVMSNPSRNDKLELLSHTAGWFFRSECLAENGINILQCEVRTKEERHPLLPNTKVIMFLGLDGFQLWSGNTENTLGEIRGSIYYVQNIPSIPSYLPQDCMDAKDYESEHNELLQGKNYDEPNIEGKGANEKRRHGVTARSNWRFWLQRDTEKAIRILNNGGEIPKSPGWFEPKYVFFPSAKDIIDELMSFKDEQLYIDIETDECLGLKCIGYNISSDRIVVFPVVDFNYRQFYPEMARILRAFTLCCNNNTVVAHNGSGFDFTVLSWKYNILLGQRLYDTMLAMHRCYPDIEKSLGHGTSLWTYEPFHKDEGSMSYRTVEDMRNLLRYCGKDVYTMRLIRQSVDAFAKTIPGLTESIAQVMDSIPAYQLMTLMGTRYKQELLDEVMRENDGLMNQYNRIIQFLVGKETINVLNKKTPASLASSNTKCVHYFHNMLGYPVVGKSKKTGNPSLAKKNMYKLRLRVENPVIDYVNLFRATQHESGMLKFNPWKS